MTLVEEVYTAAVGVVDANLAEGKDWQKSNVPRRIKRIGMAGSTAVWDTAVDVYFGAEKVMHVRNTVAGAGKTVVAGTGSFWHPSKLTLPAGVPLNIVVVDAAADSFSLYIDIAEMM